MAAVLQIFKSSTHLRQETEHWLCSVAKTNKQKNKKKNNQSCRQFHGNYTLFLNKFNLTLVTYSFGYTVDVFSLSQKLPCSSFLTQASVSSASQVSLCSYCLKSLTAMSCCFQHLTACLSINTVDPRSLQGCT